MFLSLTSDKIVHQEGLSPLPEKSLHFWFEGYFFLNDIYFDRTNIALFLEDNYNILIDSQTRLKFVNNLNGMYTLLLCNFVDFRICIITDRIHYQQLFYVHNASKISISNNYEQLINSVDTEPCMNSVIELLAYRFISNDRTIVKGAREFLPSKIYDISIDNRNQISLKKNEYWTYSHKPNSMNRAESSKNYYDTFLAVVKKYLHGPLNTDKEFALNFTAGLDSRFLLSCLLKLGTKKSRINLLTYGSQACEDVKYSSQIAKTLGITHKLALFDEHFKDFFSTKEIIDVSRMVGFSTFYYTNYGVKKLIDSKYYENSSHLLTGCDGFLAGLCITPEVIALQTFDELVEYIIEKNQQIFTSAEIGQILGKKPSEIDLTLRNEISAFFKDSFDDHQYINFYKWNIQNRERKYCNRNNSLYYQSGINMLYPFYDYSIIDSVFSYPLENILHQALYIDAIFAHGFVDNFSYLRTVPVDQRGIIKKTQEGYIEGSRTLQGKINTYLWLIIKRMPYLKNFYYDKNEVFPLYRFISKKDWNRNVTMLINEIASEQPSQLFDIKYIRKLHEENRENFQWYRFKLPSILTALFAEQLFIKKNKL